MKQKNCRRKLKRNPQTERKPEFFLNLPSETIIDILSRLPVRTILSCKCVCKQWLSLLKTDEFTKLHHSKSVPGLIVNGDESCIFYEFGDVLQLEHHEDRYIPVTEIGLCKYGLVQGSANGLLFFNSTEGSDRCDDLKIVNHVTGEYIQIHDPQRFADGYDHHFTYGFGVGRRTGQHTVVRIFLERIRNGNDTIFPSSNCQVYTLGTSSWRYISPGPLLEYDHHGIGAFHNGSLYWMVFEPNGGPLISCFDIDDEQFSTFPSPPLLQAHGRSLLQLRALEDRLCLGDVSNDEYVIWSMNEFGDKKSWSKDFVICQGQIPDCFFGEDNLIAYPVKVFEDGDILMSLEEYSYFYYSAKTKTCHNIDIFESAFRFILHSSSFLSLERFAKEEVCSFR